MAGKFEEIGYRLCWRGDWVSTLWSKVWFRFYCPCPVIENHTAKACIAAGVCGCANGVK